MTESLDTLGVERVSDIVARLRQRVTTYTKLLLEPRRVTAAHLEGARNELRGAADIIEAQSKALAEARAIIQAITTLDAAFTPTPENPNG